jgi:hypothetical protein
MDIDPFITSGISAGVTALLYIIYKLFKHSSCTSNCCGKKSEIHIDLTPPQSVRPVIVTT